MEIKIEGNPGTGNTFQEVHIGMVQNYVPNATTVINYNGTDGVEELPKNKKAGSKTMKDMLDQGLIDTENIRKEILNYVSCIRPLLKDEWKDKYMQLWEDILGMDVVSEKVYDPGKQKNTNFNRKLVAAILHFLDTCKIYKDPFNATAMAKTLEGDWEHSVRRELADDPSDDIKTAIKNLLNDKHYV